MNQVLALVNPRAYFLSLAAAANQCGVLEKWLLFRVPAHPRYLPSAINEVTPFVRFVTTGGSLPGGIYHPPELLPHLKKESSVYHHNLPEPYRKFNRIPTIREARKRWTALESYLEGEKR